MARSDMTEFIAHQIRKMPVDRRQTSGAQRQTSGQVLPGEFALRDGTPALIWPLLPTDAETLRDRSASFAERAADGSSYYSVNSMTR